MDANRGKVVMCHMTSPPAGGGRAWTLTLCGRPWRLRPHNTDPHAVTCPDCIAEGQRLAALAERRVERAP